MDRERRIFGGLMGRPHPKSRDDRTWDLKCQRITSAISATAERFVPTCRPCGTQDVRGDLLTVAFGISFGGGQTARPGNLVIPGVPSNTAVVEALRNLPELHELAQVQSNQCLLQLLPAGTDT
jgi:hypothetical protein